MKGFAKWRSGSSSSRSERKRRTLGYASRYPAGIPLEEDLAPVRARVEPFQHRLHHLENRPNRLEVGHPGEVHGHRVPPMGRAEPEVVSRDRAHLEHQ